MGEAKLKWTDDLTHVTSKDLNWPELIDFYFYNVPRQASGALISDAQSYLRQKNLPEDTQELPSEVLQAAVEALKEQPRWRPLLLGERIRKEKRPFDLPGLNWMQRVLKLGQLLIQKSWEEVVRNPDEERPKVDAGRKAQEEQRAADSQTTNGQDDSNYCQSSVTTASRQAINARSLPPPMPVAYAQQAFGPSNHSSVAPIFFSGHGESTDRANQQIALSPFGFPRQAQAQLATFCGYMQIWDFQTKSRLTAFSMNRFEDPGRILGPFILVHMQHVTYDKLQLFVMRDAKTRINIAGFALEYDNGSMTLVRNTQELRDMLVRQTIMQLGTIAQLNLTVCLRDGATTINPARPLIQNQPPPNTQASTQQLAQQHSQLPALGQQQQMPPETHSTQAVPTPSLRTHHENPRRHPAQRHQPYARSQRAQASASALSRPPVYAPLVAAMRAPAPEGSSFQYPVEPVLPFTVAQRARIIDLTEGDRKGLVRWNQPERDWQTQVSQTPQQQAHHPQASQALEQQAAQHTQEAVLHHPQSEQAQITEGTETTSIVHRLVRGNMQPAQRTQTEHATAATVIAKSKTPSVEATEEPATSRPELSYSDDSKDEEVDGFTAEAYFAAQRATEGSDKESGASEKKTNVFGEQTGMYGKRSNASVKETHPSGTNVKAFRKQPEASGKHTYAGATSGSQRDK